MTSDIPSRRLFNQKLVSTTFKNSSEVVGWFGAMQAQDFAAAKWAIALRAKDQTDGDIEQAFNNGEILRTHIMRPTWHFVHPRDIRWMLALTSARVKAFNGYYYRKSGFDKTIFKKSNEVISLALEGGKQLIRTELNILLQEAKIPTKDVGLSYALMQAELEGIICSGPRRGKQFTYMLLDERVPKTKEILRDEALAELTKRYFQSHGPAQLQDFCWWSGLTVVEAKRGIEIAKLKKETVLDKAYWFVKEFTTEFNTSVYLLPPFDEYFVAYKDRSDTLDKRYQKHMNFGGGMINGAIVINGIVVGTWKRIFLRGKAHITLMPFTKFITKELEEIKKSSQRYGRFIGMGVELEIKK